MKLGAGTLELGGGNNKFGGGNGLYVNAGTVRLNLTGTATINSHIFIGSNDGGLGAARVVYAAGATGTDQIITGANVNVNRSGVFDTNGATDQFNQLIVIEGSAINTAGGGTISTTAGLLMTGGSINTGTGTLAITNASTINSGAAATIAGNLSLNGSLRTITVNDGPTLNDLTITALVSGAGAALVKAGNGVLVLTNAGNNYTGTNTVQTIAFTGTPTGGTFTLAFNGATTAPIAYSATFATLASNITAALAANRDVRGRADGR